jgi:hypothetical protein
MGSFDFVRLAPHFAQDDSVEKFRVILLAIGQGAEEVGATRFMHKDSFLCVLRDPFAILAVRGFSFLMPREQQRLVTAKFAKNGR